MPQAILRRCFVGWSGSTSEPPVTPAGGTLVWTPPRPLWTVGDWKPHELRTAAEGRGRAAFLGVCLATDDELRRALRAVLAESPVDMLRALPGCFAVVFDDGNQAHVLTDRAGLHPVFHTRLGSGSLFASDALVLAAVHHRNLAEAVNPSVVATRLFVPDLADMQEPASVFHRVQRVGPDRVFTAPSDRSPRTDRLQRTTTGPSDVDEGAHRLLDGLLTGVYGRVRNANRVSTDLSGGLDSSTLAVLAAHAGGQPLAVTYADPYAVNDEDVHFASNVAAEARLKQHAITTGDEATLPFTAMDTAPLTDEPSLDALIIARTRFRFAPALAYHTDLHLGGDGGDVVLAGTGLTYLADLARGRLRALRHEADGWARLRHLPARQVRRAARQLARTSWADALRQLADRLADPHLTACARRALDDRLAWAALSPASAWGTLRTRRSLAGRLHATASSDSDGPPPDSADAAALRAVYWHGTASRAFDQMTRALGLTVATPYFDGQVVDACLAVPVIDRTTVDQAKPLLAAAVGDLLPPGLLTRRTKGDYTASEYYGLRANAEQLRALLTRPRLAELDILAATGPREALHRGLAGIPIPMGALGAVLATEAWLRALDAADPIAWWKPAWPNHPRDKELTP